MESLGEVRFYADQSGGSVRVARLRKQDWARRDLLS